MSLTKSDRAGKTNLDTPTALVNNNNNINGKVSLKPHLELTCFFLFFGRKFSCCLRAISFEI